MLSNWTKATTTTTGTGTITLAAVTGRPLPSKSRVTGEYVQYSIVTSDSNYESGIGKIAAADTLERTKVFSTYNGTTYNSITATALTLASGTHTVYITALAETAFEPLHFPLVGPTNPGVYATNMLGTAANISTVASQRASAYPFRLETSGLLTAMGINVATGGASSTTLLGLYEPDSNGRPGRRIAKTSATLDTSTTGYKEQAVNANVRLMPGWYWAAVCVTAGTNPTFSGANVFPSAFSRAGGAMSALIRVYENASATDLADPFPSTSLVYTTDNNTAAPNIGLILS